MVNLTVPAHDVNSLDERIKWFRRVRWAATLGHALVFAVGYFWLLPELDLTVFLSVEVLLIASNLALYRFESVIRSSPALGIVLIFDVLLLTALLYAYGGHTNPFSMVYLVHVVLAAVLVGQSWTWGIALLSSACFAALFGAGGISATSHHGAHGAGGFDLHLQGMLAAFILLSFLIAGFVSRMRLAIELQSKELMRRSANEDRLAALTQLSAGAAHELGTPLATMKLVLDDLMRPEIDVKASDVIIDLTCMKEQLNRCAAILKKMAPESGDLCGEMPREFLLSELLDSIKAGLPADRSELLDVRYREEGGVLYLPFDAVSQTVASLVSNAFDASPERASVLLSIGQRGRIIDFIIIDKGSGIDSATQARLGEPFFTTKEAGKGMGLGIFLSRLLVSRLEGSLRFDSDCGMGTTVTMELPQQVSWRKAA
jgi:two-component system sensor histidine kinase RegB